jgi:hypothetical protein
MSPTIQMWASARPRPPLAWVTSACYPAIVTSTALVGLVLAWAVLEPAVPAPPTPATWELEWVAPPECPDAAAIREQITALVPEPSGGDGVLYVDAEVEPQGDAFVLTLRTVFLERHDEREVRARVCGELAEAVALVVAISLDPTLVVTGPSVPEPVPSEPPPATSPSSPPPEPRATPDAADAPAASSGPSLREESPSRRSSRSRLPDEWMLRLAPKLEVGSLPAFGGGLDLAVGVLWPWWRLELHGSHSWPRRAFGPGGTAGRFQLGAVGVRGCGRPRVGRVELPVCVGLDGGALRVDSEGLRPANTVHGPWLAPSLGVGLAAGGTRVGFWTLVEGSATLVWSRILVGEETIFRQFPVSARWLAGIEIFFAIESR